MSSYEIERAGRLAYLSGDRAGWCPFPIESPAAIEWLYGWSSENLEWNTVEPVEDLYVDHIGEPSFCLFF
jgi:hypothetical protein